MGRSRVRDLREARGPVRAGRAGAGGMTLWPPGPRVPRRNRDGDFGGRHACCGRQPTSNLRLTHKARTWRGGQPHAACLHRQSRTSRSDSKIVLVWHEGHSSRRGRWWASWRCASSEVRRRPVRRTSRSQNRSRPARRLRHVSAAVPRRRAIAGAATRHHRAGWFWYRPVLERLGVSVTPHSAGSERWAWRPLLSLADPAEPQETRRGRQCAI